MHFRVAAADIVVARVTSHPVRSHTQTRVAPEQNSIINGLIARVERLWESEPATLNKIKPLLYIFIIPSRVLNCKCVSEIHRRPSFLPPLFFLSFPCFPCCLTTAAPLLLRLPVLSSDTHRARACFYCHHPAALLKGGAAPLYEGRRVREEALLGRGGAHLFICNQVRQTGQPHTPLLPPSRPLLSVTRLSHPSLLPPLVPLLCFFSPSASERAHLVSRCISQLSPS